MYLNRKLATDYLRQRGIKCGDSRLAHLAVTGDGPEFQYEGKFPIYTEEALDAWIESKLSAPVRSPSEAAAAASSEAAAALRKEQPSESEQNLNPPLGPPTHAGAAAAPTTPRRPGRPRSKPKTVEPDLDACA